MTCSADGPFLEMVTCLSYEVLHRGDICAFLIRRLGAGTSCRLVIRQFPSEEVSVTLLLVMYTKNASQRVIPVCNRRTG